MRAATKNGNSLRVGGLVNAMQCNAMVGVYKTSEATPIPWGITAVEKDQLRKPRSADPAKKKARKRNEASKRRSR